MSERSTRDLIVVGCSAGGVEALPELVRQLPPRLPAAIAIVQHMAPSKTPYLVEIIQRATSWPVVWAEQGEPVAHGTIYVCPPDVHLLFSEGHIRLSRSARENHARPSIDKLFRSAAAGYGARAVAVLLTGMLHDGVGGLLTVREAGGATIVQDPADAQFPDLPQHALDAMTPDQILPVAKMGAALSELVGRAVVASAVPRHIAVEAQMDSSGITDPEVLATLGPQARVTCPDCHGPMWQVGDERLRRFRCYLGHTITANELVGEVTSELESALWSAVRALNDRASTLETLAADAQRIGNHELAAAYAARAEESRRHAELARTFMLDLAPPAAGGRASPTPRG